MSRTIVVTGASRGIGLELVAQLRARGDTVLAACRSGQMPVSHGAEVLRLDVADPASVESFAASLRGRPIDVLINNAGVSSPAKTLADLTGEELSRVFSINTFAPLMLTRALLPNLRAGSGRTVFNITSQLASLTNNTSGTSTYAYRASKAALNMLTLQLAHELRPEGFCCVMVHPGWVKTDMGGPQAPLSPAQSAANMIALLGSLTPPMSTEMSGRFLNHDGAPMPW